MVWRLIIFAVVGSLLALMLTSCQSEKTLAPTDMPVQSFDTRYGAELQGVMLSVNVPAGWAARSAQEGIILSEKFGGMADGRHLSHPQVYVFVHRTYDFPLPATETPPTTVDLFTFITDRSEYVGRAHVTEPVRFVWSGHDAAYYLFNSPQDGLGVVVGVMTSDPVRLVVVNVSAPHAHAERLRGLLGQALDGIRVNGAELDGDLLRALPDPLVFPGMQNTAQG